MDTYMLCLANSYKHGGRCIAGIQLNGPDLMHLTIPKDSKGAPLWIRPISHSEFGEIPNYIAQNINVSDIIKIKNYQRVGKYSHSEDILCERIIHTGKRVNLDLKGLNFLSRNGHRLVFGNKGKALTPEAFREGVYSIMLVQVDHPIVYLDDRFVKSKERIKFNYYSNEYDFPITDPVFLDKLKKCPSYYNRQYDTLYLVLSLGIAHDGWHSKLVACVIEPPTAKVLSKVTIPLPKEYYAYPDQGFPLTEDEYPEIYEDLYPNYEEKEDLLERIEEQFFSTDNPPFPKEYYAYPCMGYPIINACSFDNEDLSLPPEEYVDEEPPFLKEELTSLEERRIQTLNRLTTRNRTTVRDVNPSINKNNITTSVLYPQPKKQWSVKYVDPPKKKEGCYIATMVYGDYDAPQVLVLRKFRDDRLLKTWHGRLMVQLYYTCSPKLVKILRGKDVINKMLKRVLDRIVNYLTH